MIGGDAIYWACVLVPLPYAWPALWVHVWVPLLSKFFFLISINNLSQKLNPSVSAELVEVRYQLLRPPHGRPPSANERQDLGAV